MAFSPQVLDSSTNSSSVDDLEAAVENAVEGNLLSGQNMGQFFSSVSDKLNSESNDLNKADKQKVTALTDCTDSPSLMTRLLKLVNTLSWTAKICVLLNK